MQQKVELIRKFRLYRDEDFEINFYKYFEDVKNGNSEISKFLNNRERKVKLDEVSYRQLNSWEKEGLLSTERENKEWRRFSIMDAVWTMLIKEFREFGMTWEHIKTAKQSLEFLSEKCGVAMPYLEFYTAFAMNKMPVLLLIFKDGNVEVASFSQYKMGEQFLGIENHIQINLNNILQNLFPKLDLEEKHKIEIPLAKDELELLEFIRLGAYHKIEVRYKNGKIDLIEGTERVKAEGKVGRILREELYKSIELIDEDGNRTKLEKENGVIVGAIKITKKKINREAP